MKNVIPKHKKGLPKKISADLSFIHMEFNFSGYNEQKREGDLL